MKKCTFLFIADNESTRIQSTTKNRLIKRLISLGGNPFTISKEKEKGKVLVSFLYKAYEDHFLFKMKDRTSIRTF